MLQDKFFPNSIKMLLFLSNLKSAVNTWSTDHSPPRLGKKYVVSEGSI